MIDYLTVRRLQNSTVEVGGGEGGGGSGGGEGRGRGGVRKYVHLRSDQAITPCTNPDFYSSKIKETLKRNYLFLGKQDAKKTTCGQCKKKASVTI